MKIKRKFLVIIVLILTVVSGSGAFAAKLKPVSVELKWFHQFQFAGIYAAKELGYYRDEGLDVTIMERDPKSSPLQDVLSGKVQFGLTDSTIIHDRLQGKRVVVLAAIFQHSPLVLLTLDKNKIANPVELKGKRIMYQKDVDDAIIVGMFNELGISKEEFISVPHNFKDDALLTDNIDAMSAYLSNQPYIYKQKGIKINIIKPANYGVDFYGDMLFTSENYFKDNKKTALAFRRATLRGWEYALAHSDQVIGWMLQKYKVRKSKAALQYEADITKRMIASDTINLGTINPNRIKRIAYLYKMNNGKLKKSSISGLLYTEYQKSESQYKLVATIICIIVVLLVIGILVVAWINRRLRRKVDQRTHEIQNSKQSLEQYIRLFSENILLLKINKAGEIVEVSNKFSQIFPSQESQIKNKNILSDFDCLAFSEDQKKELHRSINSQMAVDGECKISDDKNNSYLFEFHLTHLKSEDNQLIESVMILSDITEKKYIESRSLTDALTQIANRYALNKSLVKMLNEIDAHKKISLIMMDIDHFKRINDHFGHNDGDKVIKKIAQILQDCASAPCLVGRWGGEEFLVICNHYNLDTARQLAEKVRAAVEQEEFLDNVKLTASFGVAEYHASESIDHFINRADAALYQAKKSGRNSVKVNEE